MPVNHLLLVDQARKSMGIEARAILSASEHLNADFAEAVELLKSHNGKIIVSGMGKSGLISQKIAATLSSTGSPAVFLHPADAVHGDLGVYSPGDPTILISKSGSTIELLRLIPILREFRSPLIGILGNTNSPLARQVDITLDGSVEMEADPLNLVPTASAAVALAIGDALAAALILVRNFQSQDFARYHPAGQLGRNLWLDVADILHDLDQVACFSPGTSLKEVVIGLTKYPLGAGCVLDENKHLLGLVTDGDVRRAFQKYDDIRPLTAAQVMTAKPTTISPDASVGQAMELMENRPYQISVLPVVDSIGICLGMLRIHDIYQVNL